VGRKRVLLSLAFFASFCLFIFSGARIIAINREYATSASEYEQLRRLHEPFRLSNPTSAQLRAQQSLAGAFSWDANGGIAALSYDPGAQPQLQQPQLWLLPLQPHPLQLPQQLPLQLWQQQLQPHPQQLPKQLPLPLQHCYLDAANPDYAGWLNISGSAIDYPIVQGENNDKYLNTSFCGQINPLGAIFIDCRCASGLQGYHSIIYGHNAKNGAMFGSLHLFLDAEYLNGHRDIIVTLPDNSYTVWSVFAAYESEITDQAYRMEFSGQDDYLAFADSLGAPDGTTRILTLSTCSSGGGKHGRLLVHAAIDE
jgi:sortase B